MADTKKTYLENQLEAVMTKEEGTYTFCFQREKIHLVNGLEANAIKEVNPSFKKETVMTDDEVRISIQPPSEFKPFRQLKFKDKKSKWLFAYQLVKAVKEHSVKRLHLMIAPENIVFDKGLMPAFLHYGVKESIPPYEHDEERLFAEVKAAAALAVDWEFTFEDYLKYNETTKLSDKAKSIISSKTYEDLKDVIQQTLDELDAEEKTLIHLPKKKWKLQRYIGLALIICLIPAVLFSIYSLFFIQPKQTAFVESNRYFLNKQYSKVIDTLEKYDIDEIPESVQYQLAYSFVIVDNSVKITNYGEGQKQVLNTLTLQADPKYFAYWIQIGRGENKEALDTAHLLENPGYIAFADYKYSEEIKADESLSSDERKKQVEPLLKEKEQMEAELKKQRSKEAAAEKAKQVEARKQDEQVKLDREKKQKEEKKEEKDKKAKEDKKKKDDK
ncbi:type VII secretion protein EssB [Bacillus sp. WMMC1349]|uniref:type VII secretion protein EssB n=1 Tax=Bacillus sp. WMMC1349 TaxID=2736254 RepID=UPI001551EC46|nr:type VII secretion protein EssB [Bacillus sp. WMMC1349]NPC93996.1 type VII secretion protein EssB [Bacillus sp. WMMC1349]